MFTITLSHWHLIGVVAAALSILVTTSTAHLQLSATVVRITRIIVDSGCLSNNNCHICRRSSGGLDNFKAICSATTNFLTCNCTFISFYLHSSTRHPLHKLIRERSSRNYRRSCIESSNWLKTPTITLSDKHSIERILKERESNIKCFLLIYCILNNSNLPKHIWNDRLQISKKYSCYIVDAKEMPIFEAYRFFIDSCPYTHHSRSTILNKHSTSLKKILFDPVYRIHYRNIQITIRGINTYFRHIIIPIYTLLNIGIKFILTVLYVMNDCSYGDTDGLPCLTHHRHSYM